MQKHFDLLAECIQLEAEAEGKRLVERRRQIKTRDAEKSGETIIGLVIVDSEPSLGGRYLITLSKKHADQPLPWNRLRVGAPVVLSNDSEGGSERTGVVSYRSTHQIQVAINDWLDGKLFRLDRSPDEITRKRQLAALSTAINAKGRNAQLRDVMFGSREPEFAKQTDVPFESRLNESQQHAVRLALSCRDLAIIHGPPGTGKTTTVAELILQAARNGETVLATGPSNTAVDNLLLRLSGMKLNVVRIGHPARVAKQLQENTLDALVENHENMTIAREMIRESEALFRKLDRFTRSRPARGERLAMRADAKRLKSDARHLEKQAVEHILDMADVICITTTGDDDTLRDRFFDLVVIDEACQSTEPGCWIPLMRAERIVLAGDHHQLPPTVLSDEAAKKGFNISLMQRLIDHYGDDVTVQLQEQYRMHNDIMQFSSNHFYDGTLQAHATVAGHLLSDLSAFRKDELSAEPAQFIDTAGAGWEEELEPNGLSKLNREEALLILKKAEALYAAGLPAQDIAIIAPYAAQVRFLRDHCNIEDLEIDTVDGFQGREKEAVLITLVRSNREGEIGFLSDARRMNVALTRARRKLIVVGDSATLGNDPFFVRLIEYFEKLGTYHTVWEEMDYG